MKKIYIIASILFCVFSGVIFTGCFGHSHTMGEWSTKTPASCTQEEIKHRVCLGCGHEETKAGSPKLEHNYIVDQTVAPTQTQNGYVKYLCGCGHSYKQYTCLMTFSSVANGQNVDVQDLPVIASQTVNKDYEFLGVDYSGEYMVSEYRIYFQNNLYSKLNIGDKITSSSVITVVWQDITDEQKQFQDLIKKINKLEQISQQYNQEHNSTVDENIRVLQYIRMTRYNTSEWNLIGGTIESDFAEYVKSNQGDMDLSTLQSLQSFTIPSTNQKVDFVHLMAIINVALKNGLSSNMANDLAGWGGDFCQLVSDLKKLGLSGTTLQTKAIQLLGSEESSFGGQDLCADLDAINIAKVFEELDTKLISNAMKVYYNQLTTSQRKTKFLQNAFAQTYSDEQSLAQHLLQRLQDNLYIKIWCNENNINITDDAEVFNAVAIALSKYLLN